MEDNSNIQYRKKYLFLALAVLLLFIAYRGYIIYTDHIESYKDSSYVKCQINLKEIGREIELLNEANKSYPMSITSLPVKNKEILKCPAQNRDYLYQINTERSVFTIICSGNHYDERIEGGYPYFSSERGLVSKP